MTLGASSTTSSSFREGGRNIAAAGFADRNHKSSNVLRPHKRLNSAKPAFFVC